MLGSSVESLFERYRRKGDAEALARVFDKTSPELFRLAQHLVRDPLQAEDVLQETFVVAIDGAERWDRERPLVPWLTGILAKQASMLRRKSRRQVEPDRLHERAEADPADLAEDSELSRELHTALSEMPELYREVLHRHLLDGSKPAEIARDLDRAPGTVRMQLHRGLEQLRRALPASFAAGAALAAFSPRGMAAVREAVVTHAVEAAALSGVAAAAGGAATFAVWKVASLGAAGLALALAATVVWQVLETPPNGSSPAAPDGARASEAADGAIAEVTAPPGERGPGLDETAGPRALLVGRVLGPSTEQLTGVRLGVRGVARYDWPDELVARAVPDGTGSFTVVLDALLDHAAVFGALDEFDVVADHPAFVPARVRVAPASAEVVSDAGAGSHVVLRAELALSPAILVQGRVSAPRASAGPIHVAAVAVLDERATDHLLDATVADADGGFELRLGEPGDLEIVAAGASTRPASWRVAAVAGRVTRVPDLHLEEGIRLEGRWRNGAEPAPVDAARLEPVADQDGLPSVQLGGRSFVQVEGAWRSGTARVELDAAGRFALGGLDAGAYDLTAAALEGRDCLVPMVVCAAHRARVNLELPVERLDLEFGAGLVGLRILDAAGDPVPCGVDFEVEIPASDMGLAGELESDRRMRGNLRTSAAGELVLALPPGTAVSFSVDLFGSGGAARQLVSPAAGERHVEELRVPTVPPAASARILVAAPPGVELPPEFTVAFEASGDSTTVEPARLLELDADGLELTGLPARRLAFDLHAGGAYRHYQDLWLPVRVELDPAAGEALEERVALRRGGRLRVSARDRSGRFLPAACRVRDLGGVEQDVRFLLRGPDEQGFSPDARLSDEGPNEVHPNLEPGVYEVELSLEGRETRVVAVRVQAGETTEVQVVLP